MAGLGAAVGVSRQSVYNELGNKPALAQALVMREVVRFLAVIDEELRGGTDLVGDTRRGVRRVLAMAADNPLLQAVVASAHGADTELLPLLTTRSSSLLATVADHVTARRGGDGAAREFCDLLLMASGRYAALLHGESRTLDAR